MPPRGRTPERTQRERSEATTSELLDAARRLFAADGFAATSLDDIVAAAGVTKGALYHHFESKRDLFRAVYEREQARLAERQAQAYAEADGPWEGFFAGIRAFFELSVDPGVQRITLLDAPSVLGWEGMREIEGRYGYVQMQLGLKVLVDEGLLAPRPLGPLSTLLFGATCEASLVIARAGDQRMEIEQTLDEVRTMLEGLRT